MVLIGLGWTIIIINKFIYGMFALKYNEIK